MADGVKFGKEKSTEGRLFHASNVFFLVSLSFVIFFSFTA